jgi:hypothetical protein
MAIAAIAAAATLTAGGGATAFASQRTAAATARSAAATGFTWHPLHLINGWKAVQPSVYGTPAYALSNGVVYLRGMIRTHQGFTIFTVLPPGARPAHWLWVSFLGGSVIGAMAIEPGGVMLAQSLTGSGSQPATASLSGISFPLST